MVSCLLRLDKTLIKKRINFSLVFLKYEVIENFGNGNENILCEIC